MAVPKRRVCRARRDKRRSHHALGPGPRSNCPQCGEPKLPHRACGNCGTYRGRQIVPVENEG